MSRTNKGGKPGGYEFWSRRPQSGGRGRISKTFCHRQERAIAKQELKETLREEYHEERTVICSEEKGGDA